MESTKPTFYPHAFVERESQYSVDDFVGGNLMDKMQEDTFKGFYNFTFIYLVATVLMLIVDPLAALNCRSTTSSSEGGS